jgi:hypothetical protein
MQKNDAIYDELKELKSSLAGIPKTNVFTVPDGYFNSLSSDILEGINNEYAIENLDIPVTGMKVPEGYFEGLADSILNKIKTAAVGEEEEASVLLAPVRHINVFRVPNGYFDTLASSILDKLPRSTAKVVEMKIRSSFFKYAIAACLTGVLGLSLFSIFDKKAGIENTATALVLIDDTKDILETANGILKNNTFDQTMESLGDEEIVGYLQKNGEDVNAALVASVTDEKSLPSEDAYFIDGNTLDNFLNEQHIVQISNN